MTATALLQYVLGGLTSGSVYAIVAVSFTVVFNATGVPNFAQGAFVALGGLAAAMLVAAGAPVAVAAAVAIALAAAAGGGLHLVTNLPGVRGHTHRLIFVTLGVGIAFGAVLQLVAGTEARGLPAVGGGQPLHLGGATITVQACLVMAVAALAMGALFAFFRFARAGQAMLACSENREAAGLVGVSVGRMGLLAFALSAAIGALAGILITPITTMSYASVLTFTVKGFTAAVLGGFGNPVGAIAGVLLGLLEAFSAGLLPSGYQDAITMGILVLALMLRPGGIVGSRELG